MSFSCSFLMEILYTLLLLMNILDKWTFYIACDRLYPSTVSLFIYELLKHFAMLMNNTNSVSFLFLFFLFDLCNFRLKQLLYNIDDNLINFWCSHAILLKHFNGWAHYGRSGSNQGECQKKEINWEREVSQDLQQNDGRSK